MIQDSQGRIADRTLEHLSASDAAIVKFRRVMLAGAKALADGVEPQAPDRPQAYRLRSGSWFASEGIPFEQVMLERFGDPVGRIGEHFGGEQLVTHPADANQAADITRRHRFARRAQTGLGTIGPRRSLHLIISRFTGKTDPG